ncbi:MAG: S41 family peptidase [Pirellulaceae bacterium]|nr:S41 family peptidase [Pirellulaceae bacterium]
MPRRNIYLLFLVTVVAVACAVQNDRHGRLLVHAMREIERRHLEEVDHQDLFEGAMRGVTRQLQEKYADPYTSYVAPAEVPRFHESLDQEFGGLGIQVALPEDTKRLTVVSPLVDSPAHAAGILAGDVILKIDGRSTEGMELSDTVDLMRGKVGEPITLTIERHGMEEPFDLTLVRAIIKVDTVLGDTRNADGSWNFFLEGEDHIGYVRVETISDATARQLEEAMQWLTSHGMKGLILDLRFNSGGYLDKAVEICDMFVDSGAIVSTRRRDGKVSAEIHAKNEGTYRGFPVAVLINQYSASAAEIIAACLQDHHRATIIGQRSFGKGVVQELVYLDSEKGMRRGMMKITASSYWRPSGANINRGKDATEDDEWGVRPDEGFEIVIAEEDLPEFFKSRRLRDTFKNGEPDDKAANGKEADEDKPFSDPQLDRAVEHIRKQLADE